MKKNDSEPLLCVAAARVFWAERKLEKAVLMDSDLGDSWVWYYKFLMQHGTEEKKADVLGKVGSVEPKHGEVWQRVRKNPKNAHLNSEEVLLLAVEELE